MCCQGITGHDAVDIAGPDEIGKGCLGIGIERAGRPHDPDDFPMLLFILKQFIDRIVIFGIRCFPRAAGPEDKGIIRVFPVCRKACIMDVDSFFTPFLTANDDEIALFQIAEFDDGNAAAGINRYTIHAAFFCQ